MRKISSAWQGLGAIEMFRAWRKWCRREVRRRQRDHWHSKRDELRWSADCVAAIQMAHWNLDKFEEGHDRWSDQPFWTHSETGAVLRGNRPPGSRSIRTSA